MSSTSYGQPGASSTEGESLGTRARERAFSDGVPGNAQFESSRSGPSGSGQDASGAGAYAGASTQDAGVAAAGFGEGATQFSRVLSDLQDLVARAGNVSGEDLAQLRTQIADKFSDAKDKVGELTEDAAAATRQGADAAGEVIRAHPLQAVAVAAVAGVLIGMLLARR